MRLGVWPVLLAFATLGGPAGPSSLLAQASLETVVERARLAWSRHDTRDLVGESDTVRLRIPGVGVGAALRSGQAARLLSDYLSDTDEVALSLREVRYLDDDHAYAEFGRRFAVRGTADVREQAVFFGFLRLGGAWRLREVRITP
jgi:hypothetical protein